MATYNFQAGDNQQEGRNFREKLRLDAKKQVQLVAFDNHQEVYNIPEYRATLVVGYKWGHVGKEGEEESVLLTVGRIVSPNPRKIAERLEKLTEIKLTEIKDAIR